MVDETNLTPLVTGADSGIESIVSGSASSSSEVNASTSIPDFLDNLSGLTGYSTLAKDLLSGKSAKKLRKGYLDSTYVGGANLIHQIGGKSSHKRGNHSLLDRISNASDLFDQLLSDYNISHDQNSNIFDASNVENYSAQKALDELSLLEEEVKKFDVSNQRLRRVKDSNQVRNIRNGILDKISAARQSITEEYGLVSVEEDLTEDLINDILKGKSARYLQSEYSTFNIKKNHAWEDRIDNARFVLYNKLGFDPSKDQHVFKSVPGKNKSEEIISLVEFMKSSLKEKVPKKYQLWDRNSDKRDIPSWTNITYDLTIREFDHVLKELDRVDYFVNGQFEQVSEQKSIPTPDPVNAFPLRYVADKENNQGKPSLAVFDLREKDQLKEYSLGNSSDSSINQHLTELLEQEIQEQVLQHVQSILSEHDARVMDNNKGVIRWSFPKTHILKRTSSSNYGLPVSVGSRAPLIDDDCEILERQTVNKRVHSRSDLLSRGYESSTTNNNDAGADLSTYQTLDQSSDRAPLNDDNCEVFALPKVGSQPASSDGGRVELDLFDEEFFDVYSDPGVQLTILDNQFFDSFQKPKKDSSLFAIAAYGVVAGAGIASVVAEYMGLIDYTSLF